MPALEGSDAVSDVPEAELREWEERVEDEQLGSEGRLPPFLPTPDILASAVESKGKSAVFFSDN